MICKFDLFLLGLIHYLISIENSKTIQGWIVEKSQCSLKSEKLISFGNFSLP